ncbi:unnamed protein product, partial [Lampetra planeri]
RPVPRGFRGISYNPSSPVTTMAQHHLSSDSASAVKQQVKLTYLLQPSGAAAAMESLTAQLDFHSPRHTSAAVLKEKGANGQITQSSVQGAALDALWQQCCGGGGGALVRSSCCDAVVLLVEQGHADLHYVLNSVLNLLPSARNVQGLMKVIGRLLQMQADQRGSCLYSIRNAPAYITFLAPFLCYLYCDPLDSVEAVLELCGFMDALLLALSVSSDERWRSERVGLLLQLLCACHLGLQLNADCRPLVGLMQGLLPSCQQLLACSGLTEPLAEQQTHKLNQDLAHRLFSIISSQTEEPQQTSATWQLDACQAVAAADPFQVPSLLPVLLLKLGKEKNPVLARAVLDCLPNLGTHKDRVYPELQRLLAQQDPRVLVGRDTEWEQLLSGAACLRDVCRERPYQHGGDMLAAITCTLNRCTGLELEDSCCSGSERPGGAV